MRTASNLLKLQYSRKEPALLMTLMGVLLLPMSSAFAVDANPMAPIPALAAPAPALVAAAPTPLPMPGFPAPAVEPAKAPSADLTKNLTATEDKVIESAKTLAKHLENSSEAMTLEDLNTARQTIARIDAMIDIEKHMGELEKVRNDRNGHSAPSMAAMTAAIPASALSMPQMMPAQMREPMEPPHNAPRMPSFSASTEISRITGLDGHYAALLKVNGETKTVHVGDQLSGAGTIKSITASTVSIEDNGEMHTLHIKNVDAIYSAMR